MSPITGRIRRREFHVAATTFMRRTHTGEGFNSATGPAATATGPTNPTNLEEGLTWT